MKTSGSQETGRILLPFALGCSTCTCRTSPGSNTPFFWEVNCHSPVPTPDWSGERHWGIGLLQDLLQVIDLSLEFLLAFGDEPFTSQAGHRHPNTDERMGRRMGRTVGHKKVCVFWVSYVLFFLCFVRTLWGGWFRGPGETNIFLSIPGCRFDADRNDKRLRFDRYPGFVWYAQSVLDCFKSAEEN